MRTALIALALCVVGLSAQERVDLTTPVTKTQSSYTLVSVIIEVENQTITIIVRDNIGSQPIRKMYSEATTPTGAALIAQLNRGNFSTNSLMKAIYNRLISDGVIPAGSIVGVP